MITKLISLFLFVCTLFIGCSCLSDNHKFINNTNNNIGDTSSIDFLRNPQHCVNVGYALGATVTLYRTHSKDSLFMVSKDFYDCKETYEVDFLYKDLNLRKVIVEDSLSKILTNEEKSSYPDFDCFAFVFKETNPDSLEDRGNDVLFPLNVKAYKRIDKTKWQYKGKTKAKTLEDFGEFQFKIIYDL